MSDLEIDKPPERCAHIVFVYEQRPEMGAMILHCKACHGQFVLTEEDVALLGVKAIFPENWRARGDHEKNY